MMLDKLKYAKIMIVCSVYVGLIILANFFEMLKLGEHPIYFSQFLHILIYLASSINQYISNLVFENTTD